MGFECYHPAINFFFFLCAIVGTVLFRQPVFLALSYLCAFAYSVKRSGRRALIFDLCLIPVALLIAFYYSGFHHFGLTVLGENFIGNKITLESLAGGLTLGFTVVSVLMWCSCLFSVFTTDKVVYLFGRISPRLSLFLSMALRMFPRLKVQAKKISVARKAVGRGTNQGNLFRRLQNGVKIFSMLVTWFIESMGTLSDSMRSRGYALRGRTAFSIYRFDNRDRSFIIGLFACATLGAMGHLLGQTRILFDPEIYMNPITPLSGVFYGGYAVLCLLPMALEIIGQLRFRQLRSQI